MNTRCQIALGLIFAAGMSLSGAAAVPKPTAAETVELRPHPALEEAVIGFDLLYRLMELAEPNSVAVSYPDGGVNEDNPVLDRDAIRVDLRLPAGVRIWPNDRPPHDRRHVRIQWQRQDRAPDTVTVAAAASAAALAEAPRHAVAGGRGGTPIVNLDIWPVTVEGEDVADGPAAGFQIVVTGRAPQADPDYRNLQLPEGHPLRNFRTYTAVGIARTRR